VAIPGETSQREVRELAGPSALGDLKEAKCSVAFSIVRDTSRIETWTEGALRRH
jgi:hypothetical protein